MKKLIAFMVLAISSIVIAAPHDGYNPDSFSEDAQYQQDLLIDSGITLGKNTEDLRNIKVSIRELTELVTENKAQFQEIRDLLRGISDTLVETSEKSDETKKQVAYLYELSADSKGSTSVLIDAINGVAGRLDKTDAHVSAFAAKLDTDAVAQNAAVTSSQLDTDYEVVVDTL